MVYQNCYDGSYDCEKDAVVNGEHLTMIVSHKLDQANLEFSGWFISILTHDWETDEIDWGFCSGWCQTYHEALNDIMNQPSYQKYPFPVGGVTDEEMPRS